MRGKVEGFVIEREVSGRWSDDIALAFGVDNAFETENEAHGALKSTRAMAPGEYRVTPVWL